MEIKTGEMFYNEIPYYEYVALNPRGYIDMETYEREFFNEDLIIQYVCREEGRITSVLLANLEELCFYVTPETLIG